MKKTHLFFMLSAFIFSLIACQKDQVIKPVITNIEIGHNNSRTVTSGHDLHLEANIEATEKINLVTIEIHPESGQLWHFDTTYTKFSGQKNTLFHEHLSIPAGTEKGAYHFHLKVIDMEGNSTEFNAELEIIEP